MGKQFVPIQIWDREKGHFFEEKVLGKKTILFLYQTRFGLLLEGLIFCRAFVSKLMGWFQSSRFSRYSIASFVKEYDITLSEYEEKPYSSFNAFFVRQFKEGMRSFSSAPSFPAFAEGRFFGFQSMPDFVPVKGVLLGMKTLFGEHSFLSSFFQEGPGLIARLCPVDYHRFHAMDDAVVEGIYWQKGVYHSVNPWALQESTFCANARVIVVLNTKHFGKIAFIPVGALGVGKIVLSLHVGQVVKRGEDLGCFLFGASTVIVLGQKGFWNIDSEILLRSSQSVETYVRLGSQIGVSVF
jgi:phosphatidylserine decarboxylase